MYNKKDILKTLNEFNYFIEEQVLDSFIKEWKIDPIYEDEDGVEFFDNLSIVKIKKGISLKSQGYDCGEIVYHINKILAESPVLEAQKAPAEKVALVDESTDVLNLQDQSADMKNVTIDVTSQTLQMLAEAVASKISAEIKQQLLLENPLKENNDALSKQVSELLEDNKKLAERIEQLEGKKFCFLTWLENFIASRKA